jgi:hypothetical protein
MRIVILLAMLAMVCVSCEKDIHEASINPASTPIQHPVGG